MAALSPDDEIFNRIPFSDLDTLTNRDLHALNAELATAGEDLARVEQWRARVAEILVGRI